MDEADIYDAASLVALDLSTQSREAIAKLITKFLLDVERIADAAECIAACAVDESATYVEYNLHNGETEGSC